MTPETEMLIEERLSDGTLLLRLNRPGQRNALATPLLAAIARALSDADADPDVRCALITGSETVFAAGADLDELAAADGSEPVEGPRWQAWRAIGAFTKPLIAAVEGWCLGAGCELMLRCDIVVAAAGAKIGQPETNLGIIPGAGGTAILPRLVGRAVAIDMLLTGEPIGAQRAYDLGLVARVTDQGAALETALALAAKISARAPQALRAAKASILATADLTLGDHLRSERARFLQLLGGSEKPEGIAAFRERRIPIWPRQSLVTGDPL